MDTIILPDINLICLIGGKDYIDTPKNTLYDFLKEKEINFTEINIKHDFLLWMLWKLYENDKISDKITLESFENLRVGIPNSSKIEYDNTLLVLKHRNHIRNYLLCPYVMVYLIKNH